MGLLTPLAIKIGSIPWMPKYLPQIVKCDKAIAAVTRQRYGLLDIAGLPHITDLNAGTQVVSELTPIPQLARMTCVGCRMPGLQFWLDRQFLARPSTIGVASEWAAITVATSFRTTKAAGM